ncbi:MAG: 4-(cytidine 5'-diphospho)-2-C-methyl-D-erythritol kinase [Flavobacteriales bacterium]|nr:4-(cytidine 5'-diphospho)-2-C-methyl-D-erythritol kinase [Flavobacteriales bacterium]|tara:strand:- start:7195 stop:7983 length:789 start_codon:yes stop_codon:yes gene_type:complete
MLFFPNAKINIGLSIISKRADGYHNLESILYPIAWCDILEIIPSKQLSFESTGLTIPGQDNLCLKAYELMESHYDIASVSIHLHKNIPIGAGLGGGSSDAAFTLMALNTIFELDLEKDQLKKMAAQLGADCPFFIYNTPSLASGIGEILNPIDLNMSNYHLLVVKPDVFVSTSEAFSFIEPQTPSLSLLEEVKMPIEKWTLKNDFEDRIFPHYPEILEIKKSLIQAGALYASMSGSGSSIYGIFLEKPQLKFDNCQLFHQVL